MTNQRNTKKSRLKLALLFAGISTCNGLHAKDDYIELDAVLVTATQTNVSVSDAPAAANVVSSSQLETIGGDRVLESLKTLPGVFIRDNTLPSSWTGQAIMRGVAGYNRNAVMIDGQPLNNGFSSGVNWSVIDPESVERVEVVRGPFSSLYGGSAMGGAINIISKRPGERTLLTKGSYGSNDTHSAFLSYTDVLAENVAFQLDLSNRESKGFVQEYVAKSPSSGTGVEGSGYIESGTSTGGSTYIVGDRGATPWHQRNAGLTFHLGNADTGTLTLGLRYHEHQQEIGAFNSYVTVDGQAVYSGSVAINDSQRLSLRPGDFANGPTGEEAWRFNAKYQRQLENGIDLTIDTFHADNSYWYISPSRGSITEDGGESKRVDIPNTRNGVRTQFNFNAGENHTLVAGLSFARDTLDKVENDIENWRDRDCAVVGDDLYRADGQSETFALFLQDEIRLSDSLTAYLGARYDLWETWGTVEQLRSPAFVETYEKRDHGSLTPKASLVYKPAAGTTLRASAGSAFRAPTLSDRYSTWIATSGSVNYASPDLVPETMDSIEVGFDQLFAKNRIRFTGTVFQNELSDMISNRSVANPNNASVSDRVRVNIGEARIRGFETSLEYQLPDFGETRLFAFANYTYNGTEVLKNDADPASVGKHLTLVPEEMFAIGLRARSETFFGHLTAQYTGSLYGDSDNSDTFHGVYGAYDSSFVVDTRIGYSVTEKTTLSLSVFNLFDRDYFQSSPAPGRRITGEFSYKF